MLSVAAALAVVAALCPLAAGRSHHITRADQVVLKDLEPGGVMFRNHSLPPQIPLQYYLNDAHYQYTRYNLRNPEYRAWVIREHLPRNHKWEEYAFTRDWDAFMPGGEDLLHPQDTVVGCACSPERLPFVKRMLHHWQGPMALVLFIPYPSETDKAVACRSRTLDYVLHMTQDTKEPFALSFIYANEEQLAMHCDVFSHSTGLEPAYINEAALRERYANYLDNYWTMYDGLYPINQARNTVINMVKTNAFVMLVDADFVPSGLPGTFHKQLLSDPALARIRANWNSGKVREVLTIPPFGRLRTNLHESPESSPCFPATEECWLYQKVDVPFTKERLVEMVTAGEVEPFYQEAYSRAYGCVLPDVWLQTKVEYEIFLEQECEPFLVALKDSLPQFSTKFRGYQMDKVSHSQHLAILGTKFTVHPNLFIIHLPHAKGFNIDSVLQTKKPAKHDQWTALRLALAITLGDFVTNATYERLIAEGKPVDEARMLAQQAGFARLRNVSDYFAGYLPEADWKGESTQVIHAPQQWE